ncbi:MAG: winged helix-turn-helix domain-containing protein [Thermoproteota archaeon]|jgi:methanogenic corrinoid protein MtbC1|nr:winged helix-turn-helix domain-containing protein [Thermoproteota archaeon]
MYRRYTLDEIKRRIVDVLQSAGGTGLSGVELADRIGINRMTITKYLDVMHAMGLLKKKKIGNVNIWFVQIGVGDIEFPINYVQVQQKLISSILAGDEDIARRILLSVMNSNVDQVKVMTDVIVPAVNTISELYNRGKLNKTERTFLLSLMMELIDLVKFNVRPGEQKPNAHVICVAGSEDRSHMAKSAAVALLARGWDSSYIGDVGEQIDPFFDIDFQRYLLRLWSNKHGLMLVCIFSSGEGSLRFLSSTAKQMKGRVRGELRITTVTTPQLQTVAEESSDYVAKDLLALVEWAEREFNYRISA